MMNSFSLGGDLCNSVPDQLTTVPECNSVPNARDRELEGR
eukprot:COSAG02_NODE_711_length_18126_cov_43.786986_7_plen_40_part_00